MLYHFQKYLNSSINLYLIVYYGLYWNCVHCIEGIILMSSFKKIWKSSKPCTFRVMLPSCLCSHFAQVARGTLLIQFQASNETELWR